MQGGMSQHTGTSHVSMILMTMLPVEAHAEERCRVAP
jgi:hypothetical protein